MKLKSEQRAEIVRRKEAGESVASLAAEFDVTKAAIYLMISKAAGRKPKEAAGKETGDCVLEIGDCVLEIGGCKNTTIEDLVHKHLKARDYNKLRKLIDYLEA